MVRGVARQPPPGKIGARGSEAAPALSQKPAQRMAPARADSGRRTSAAPGRKGGAPQADAVPFEFGAVAVHPAADPARGDGSPPGPAVVVPAQRPAIEPKAPGQPTPPLAPAKIAPAASVAGPSPAASPIAT